MGIGNVSGANRRREDRGKLSANERAIVDHIRVPALRRLVESLVLLKKRLQFTGWLQYVVPAFITAVVVLIAGAVSLLWSFRAAEPEAVLAALFLAIVVFDLVTVKLRVRLPERLPERNDDLDLFDLMRARRSCRSFQLRKLTPADHAELMESVARHTAEPTIGTSPIRFEYVCAPLTVWPTVNAGEFLVAIAPKEYDRLAVIDVGRTLQRIVMDATRMGLGTCWIGPGADHASVAHHLGQRFDPERDHIICVCAVGYRSRYVPVFIRVVNARFHRRLPLSTLFFADSRQTQPLEPDSPGLDRFGRTFEICQWAPSSFNGQTTRAVAVTTGYDTGNQKPEGLDRVDFYSTTESRYYAPVAAGIWCSNWEMCCNELGIEGHPAVLPADERGGSDGSAADLPPNYNVSWVATA